MKYLSLLKNWKGGQSREFWNKNNKPKTQEDCDLDILFKSADTQWRQAKNNLGMSKGFIKRKHRR